MIIPCPKHVLCPEGTGTESPGVNYSSETIDIPEFRGRYYPPSPYGFYTACLGRCVSLVSQLDADLCAQRLGQICLNHNGVGPGSPNNTTPPKPVYCNTVQLCNSPNTGRLVVVPADVICAESQAEANAEALSLANILQKDPATPLGPSTVPGPTPSKPPINVGVPRPTPQPPKPPPASQCKPCDDTGAVGSFSVVCNIPPDTEVLYFESPPLKCGRWRFSVATNNPGGGGDTASFIVLAITASDPARTLATQGLVDCPNNMSWKNPCSPGDCTGAPIVLQWGYLFCCSDTSIECGYAVCQQLDSGNWMPMARWFYDAPFPIGNSAKQFTMNGVWLGPVPPP